jgi:hypothetical protein
MLRMPNEQRTKFHPSSNFSETYTSNTPKCNVQQNATGTYSNNQRKSIIHGQNESIRERHAGEMPGSNIKNIL